MINETLTPLFALSEGLSSMVAIMFIIAVAAMLIRLVGFIGIDRTASGTEKIFWFTWKELKLVAGFAIEKIKKRFAI